MLGGLSKERLEQLARKFGVDVPQLRKTLTPANETLAVWWDKVLGPIVLTDTGEYDANENLQDFNQRKTLFPGKDNFVVLPREGVLLNTITDDQGNFLHYEREFLPTAFNRACYVLRHTQGSEVGPSHLFTDVKQQQVIHVLEVLFFDWVIDLNTANDLIQFPEIVPNVFFRLVAPTTTTYTEGKQFVTKAVFQSINDVYSNSGRAIDQYVHKSTPGECFPEYKVVVENNKKVLQLATERLWTVPVTNIQLELFGAGVINSITVYGRPTSNYGKCTPKEELKPTTIILAQKFLTPQTSTLTKKALPTSNFYFFRKGHTDVRFYYGSYNDKLNSFYDEQTRSNSQGFLVIEPPTSDISAIMGMRKSVRTVNPIDGTTVTPTGDADNDWNRYFNQNTDKKSKNTLGNTGLLPQFAVRTKLWDDHEIPLVFDGETQERLWVINFPFLKTEEAHYDDAVYHYVNLPTTMLTHDIFNLNSLLYFDTWKLPVDFTTVTTVSNAILQLIGGLLDVIGVGGIPSKFQFAHSWTPQKTFMGFVPSALAEWSMCYINNPGNRCLLPLGMFRNDTVDTALPLVAPHCENTTVRFELTDQVKDKTTQKIYNVIDLGQDPKRFPDKADKIWKYDPVKHTAIPRSETTTGFYVDAVVIKAIAKADFRLSFYNGHTPLWQGRYQTESKWDGNDRSWATIIRFSPWGSNLANKHEYPYPKPWNFPIPPHYDYDWQTRVNFWWEEYEWLHHFKAEALVIHKNNETLDEDWSTTDSPAYPLIWTPFGSNQTPGHQPFGLNGVDYDYTDSLIIRPDSSPVKLWLPFFVSFNFLYQVSCIKYAQLGKWQLTDQWVYGGTHPWVFKVVWTPINWRYVTQNITEDGQPSFTITEKISLQVWFADQRSEWGDNYECDIRVKISWDKDTPNKALFNVTYESYHLVWMSRTHTFLNPHPPDYLRFIGWNQDPNTRTKTPNFWIDWLPYLDIKNWNFVVAP